MALWEISSKSLRSYADVFNALGADINHALRADINGVEATPTERIFGQERMT